MSKIISTLSKMWLKVVNLENSLFPVLKENLRIEEFSSKESKLIKVLDFAEIEKFIVNTSSTNTPKNREANETLHITGTGGDGDKIDSDMLKGSITQTDTYIEDANGNQLYKTKQAAEDALGSSGSTPAYYHLQTSDIAGHTIKVGDPSKDKQYNADGTFTSLDSKPDTGTWSITDDGKLRHVWDSNGNVEIYRFADKPATGVMLTNETYDQSGKITDYI